jgi:hypothetical protein
MGDKPKNKTKENDMNSFSKILKRMPPKPTGQKRTVKEVWFLDGASPLRLYPGESLSREYLAQYSQIVEIVDVEQVEVDSDGKILWEDK